MVCVRRALCTPSTNVPELTHFCWRERGAPLDQPELDLVTIPTDCHFIPYENRSEPTARTNGRLFVLKFSSSPARHLFWLQSKPQARNGDPSWFSPRDLKIGQIVDDLLQGEDVDVQNEIAQVEADGQNDDDDETMEDIEGHGDPNSHHRAGSGGAGPDATGGDVREEGESAREGGADGGRA
jgi:26S proteasome regulatory subunit N13